MCRQQYYHTEFGKITAYSRLTAKPIEIMRNSSIGLESRVLEYNILLRKYKFLENSSLNFQPIHSTLSAYVILNIIFK